MSDPFDHLPDEDDLLAVSALLDGTATVEDEARVRSNPDLVALLDDLTGLRDQLRDVGDVTAPAGTRELALAAALAAFDDEQARIDTDIDTDTDTDDTLVTPAPAPAPLPANVVRFERRRRWAGVVTGAAAAGVAALFVGALALGGLSGSDQDDSASVATEAEAAEAAKADTRIADAPASQMSEAASATTAAGGDVLSAAGGSGQAEADSTYAATETTAAAAGDVSEAAGDTIPEIQQPAAVDAAATVSISTPEQLRDWAASQQGLIPLPGLGLPCVADGSEAVGEVVYQGASVVVARAADGTVTAFDPQTDCTVVVSVEP